MSFSTFLRLRLMLAALLGLGLILGVTAQASAQMPPYTAYGMGLHAGDIVTASIDSIECGRAKVSAAGNWKISIFAEAPCNPVDGSVVHFAVNGVQHAATVRWSGGGAPVNPRVGVVLGTAPALLTSPAKTTVATPGARAKATATARTIPTRTPTPRPAPRPVTRIPQPWTPFR